MILPILVLTFCLALDKSADINDVSELSSFIEGIDDKFNIFEELIGLESLHGKARLDAFEKVKSCPENLQLDSCKLITVCTDGASSMISKAAGTSTLVENYLGHCLIKCSDVSM